jgi:ABC-type molybdenum transport system ATPase subunit/photorepair protein PhrA
MSIKKEFSTILSAIKDREYRIFDAVIEDKPVFDELFVDDNESNVIIIYGDNASGKSLFASIIETILRQDNMPVRSASMKNRTSSGIQKILIFGDEASQSTGQTSFRVANLCLKSTVEHSGAVAILDEPDVGLSDRFQSAFGEHIAQTIQGTENTGLVIISHSAALIDSFLTHFGNPVSFLGICTNKNYRDWVDSQEAASVDELLALTEKASRKHRAILKALNGKD